jgi:two-component system sensor histidine kinase PilS (NtrC family)
MNSNSTFSIDGHQKSLKNAKGLMLCRIIILTLLLAITLLFQVSEKKYFFIPMTNDFYYFISFFYLITIFYAMLLKRIKDYQKFNVIQIFIDHLFITGLIYFTGGNESFFPVTYIFTIIGSSILFYKRGAFFSASLSTFFYGLLLLLQLHHWINPLGRVLTYEASQIFYSLIIYMAAFYIVAFLSSTISEELKKKRKELIQKQVDYDQLETFNRNIIQSLDSGLLTIDLNGRINFLNRTAAKILNRSGEELMNGSIYDLFPKIDEMLDELRRKPQDPLSDYQRYETVFTNHEGRGIHLGFSISPLADPNGLLIGHTLIFQDITKFREMEEQIKRFDKMAAIGLLAAGIAHEIRNPLASLSGSIQMLNSELVLDHQQRHLMEISIRESERLNALISDFMLFAQPPQTHKVPGEIRKIIEETVQLFVHSPSFHEGIQIFQPPTREDFQAMVDPSQMKQVFWNLLINAAQAMNNGGEIHVHMERGEDHLLSIGPPWSSQSKVKEWVKIAIADSGNGIPPEEKEKIFEPFYTTKEGGTGLGLSIVHKIIENHNGIIKVESEKGKGSLFTIYLPTG